MTLFWGASKIRPAVATAPTADVRAAHGKGHTRVILQLPPRVFAVFWVAFVAVSTCNALLATIFAAVYYAAMTIRGGYMLDAVGLMSAEDIPIVLASYAVFALFFWKTTFEAIFDSIRSRRLLLQVTPPPRTDGAPPTYWQKKRREWAGKIPNMFETVFLVRELIEVSTQSYQAYKSSKLISQQWINNFYVGTLALNCWISPIIHARTHRHPALQRLLYLSSDVVLDFASTSVIPICIIFSIVLAAFTVNISLASGDMDYAFDVPSDDVTFVNMVKAVQQVFVVTWFDFITKMLPFLSMANCLDRIKELVQPQPPRNSTTQRSQRPEFTRVQAIPRNIDSAADIPPVKEDRRSSRKRIWSRMVTLLLSTHTVHALLGVWGCCIVGFHTQAWLVASRTAPEATFGCKSNSQPWFVKRFSCTVLEINCNHLGFGGDATEIAATLNFVDPQGITTLIISHCPQLHVPPQIQSLTNLLWLEIYNATLYAWEKDAALVETKFPAIQYLCVLFVNMSALPDGLQSSNFPVRLRDITIAGTNLTTLPPDLHTKWKRLVNLALERNAFPSLPSTVPQLNPERLSLFGNHITTIPDGLFPAATQFSIFSVAKNPVSVLPDSIGNLKKLALVILDYTDIRQLPAWLVNEGERRAGSKSQSITVSAGGSRLCRESASINASGLLIVCREKQDIEIEAYWATFYNPLRQP